MHGKMQRKKCIILMIITAVAFGSLTSGCAGKQDDANGLMELTEPEATEEAESESGSKGTAEELQESVRDKKHPDIAAAEEVYVHVCGEVMNPGVYMLPAGSRVYEAIESAGGLREEAAEECLNQAAQVEDGQQIYVPSEEEAAQGLTVSQGAAEGQEMSGGSGRADDGKISLNSASKEQLMTLSGIGEAKATAIIGYREEHGGFQRIEELMEVEGIKEGVFNKVKDQIKI